MNKKVKADSFFSFFILSGSLALIIWGITGCAPAPEADTADSADSANLSPIRRVVDLDTGEEATVELADGSSVPLTAPAVKFSRTPVRIRTRAPTLGEHNDAVLESIGYGPDAIQALKDTGAI